MSSGSQEVLFILTSKKSQVWFTDLFMAMVIFSVALLLYMKVSSNLSDTDDRQLEELKADSAFIAESLVGTGYPDGWNSSNAEKIGLTDGGQILNTSKVSAAAAINYTTLKVLFGTRNDFFAFFQDKDGNVLNLGSCGTGQLAIANITPDICNNVSVKASKLAKSERIVYSGKAVRMSVYAWRT